MQPEAKKPFMAPSISVKYRQTYWKLRNVACVTQATKHPTVSVTCAESFTTELLLNKAQELVPGFVWGS